MTHQDASVVRNDQFRSHTSHQWSGTDLWQLVRLRGRRCGDRPAIIWHPFVGDGYTWTYDDLVRQSSAVAAGMTRRGVKRGDRVLIHLDNCPEFIVSWYACAAIGAVAVTTNTRSAGDELRYYADDCEAVCAITQPRFAELVAESAKGIRWQVVVGHDAGQPADNARCARGDDAFESLLADPNDLVESPPDPWAPMSVQYTSGTTSRPKGVLWTHANALWGARVNAVHEDLHPDDCHLVYMPLFHTNALAYSMLASLYVGARFVLIPKWSTSRFWDISMKYGCTWLSLMGLSLRTVREGPPARPHSYRMFGTGVCDGPWDEQLGVKTIGWWGMTETISHGIVGDPFTPNRPMSMGRPAPEYGIAVVRDDGITAVEAEEAGQLLVKGTRGLSIFAEYLNKPEATAESFDEWGWLRTGDLVTPHADGYLSFTDRAKDMLKVGAENVAASEVERVIMTVAGIKEAAVVGRPDDKLDEVPVAFITAVTDDPGLPERVMAACRQNLADFKVPRNVFTISEMPRSTISKINKVQLRNVAAPDADRDSAVARWIEEAKSDPSGDQE